MRITLMSEQHIAAIARLETLCFSDPWPEEAIRPELTNPLSFWLVALDGETVAGYAGSQMVIPEADVMNVAVHPDYRRQGIARRLLEALIKALSDRDVNSLALEVRASNAPAIALYESLGFTRAGCRRNYYHNPKEDALILRKEWEA